jgi:hypothetical protein
VVPDFGLTLKVNMTLSKETIDKEIKPCYPEEKGEISASIVEPIEGISRKRLLKALSLILSEEDIADYFRSRDRSSRAGEGDFGIKRRANT